jgi:hypothetical protein
MKLIVLFFLLPIVCYPGIPTHKGKVDGYLNAYFAVEGLAPHEYSDFYSFLDKLDNKRPAQVDKQFLKQVFKKNSSTVSETVPGIRDVQ